MGRENKQVGTMANLLLPNFYVLPALSSQLSVFSKLCIVNTLLHFLLLLCQSCRSLRNVSLVGRILGLIKSAYHGWLSMMTSSKGPLFSLASGPPHLSPPLVTSHISLHTWSRSHKVLPKSWHGRETTLATGHQDDNKNTYEANILCSL